MSPCLEEAYFTETLAVFTTIFFLAKHFWKYVSWESTIAGITYSNLGLLTLRHHFGIQKRLCAHMLISHEPSPKYNKNDKQ